MDNTCFVIVRHINSAETNEYWLQCYRALRRFYTNYILIVDDNSDLQYIHNHGMTLQNCDVIASEFPGRGEILGHYYFYMLRPAARAVVLHDSVFLRRRVDFGDVCGGVRFLWTFRPVLDVETRDAVPAFVRRSALGQFRANNVTVADVYARGAWTGCFGLMAVIDWLYIHSVCVRWPNLFAVFLADVRTRADRIAAERVFACLCQMHSDSSVQVVSAVFGDIRTYSRWGITYAQYVRATTHAACTSCRRYNDKCTDCIIMRDLHKHIAKLPAVKVWTGR